MPNGFITAEELQAVHQRLVDAGHYSTPGNKNPDFEDLRPVIIALLVTTIVAILFRCSRNNGMLRGSLDLTVCLACFLSTRTDRSLLLALATQISAGYLTWTMLPTPAGDNALPSHKTFMRGLPTAPTLPDKTKRSEDNVSLDCMICWDDTSRLARLSCNHEACRNCLQTMGERNQTACPLCRKPLFTTSTNDRLILAHKLRAALHVANCPLHIVTLLYHLQGQSYISALSEVTVLTLSTVLPLYAMARRMRDHGRNWWREGGTFSQERNARMIVLWPLLTLGEKWMTLLTLK